jgi:hypothetical protein
MLCWAMWGSCGLYQETNVGQGEQGCERRIDVDFWALFEDQCEKPSQPHQQEDIHAATTPGRGVTCAFTGFLRHASRVLDTVVGETIPVVRSPVLNGELNAPVSRSQARGIGVISRRWAIPGADANPLRSSSTKVLHIPDLNLR